MKFNDCNHEKGLELLSLPSLKTKPKQKAPKFLRIIQEFW